MSTSRARRASHNSDADPRRAMSSDGAPAFADLWRRYFPPRRDWDDSSGPKWRNLVTTSSVPDHNISVNQICGALGLSFPSRSRHVRAAHRLHWLHIPKTGTSFGTTLMHRGCPRIPEIAGADDGAPIVSLTERYPRSDRRWCDRGAFLGNLNGHEPVRYPMHRGHTAALLRRPRDRAVSECAAIASEFRRAFGAARIEPLTAGGRPGRLGHGKRRRHRRGSGVGNDARAADGDGLGEGVQTAAAIYAQPFLREFLLSHGMSRTGIAALSAIWNDENQSIPLHRCLGLRGIKGCQVKMVLGVPCAAPFALNESLLAEAARRVASDFLFVGLTERWEASICLFHARLGGKALPIQFANSRRGQHHERSSSASETSLLSDEWDERLYQVAVHRFERDLAAARKATSIAVSSLHGRRDRRAA